MDDRLYRSVDDRMLAGVAGGVAERLDADPSIIRVVWAHAGRPDRRARLRRLRRSWRSSSPRPRTTGRRISPCGSPRPTRRRPGQPPRPFDPAAPPDPDAPTAATAAALATDGTARRPPRPPARRPAAAGSWVAPDGRTVARAAEPTQSRRRRSGADRRDDRGPLIGGLVLILIGGFFLLRQFIPAIDLGSWWPLILVGIGVILVIMSVRPDRTSG